VRTGSVKRARKRKKRTGEGGGLIESKNQKRGGRSGWVTQTRWEKPNRFRSYGVGRGDWPKGKPDAREAVPKRPRTQAVKLPGRSTLEAQSTRSAQRFNIREEVIKL